MNSIEQGLTQIIEALLKQGNPEQIKGLLIQLERMFNEVPEGIQIPASGGLPAVHPMAQDQMGF